MIIDLESGWNMSPEEFNRKFLSFLNAVKYNIVEVGTFSCVRDFEPSLFPRVAEVLEAVYEFKLQREVRIGFWDGAMMLRDETSLGWVVPVVPLEQIQETLVSRGLLDWSIFERGLSVDDALMAACDQAAWLQVRELKLHALCHASEAASYHEKAGSKRRLYLELLMGVDPTPYIDAEFNRDTWFTAPLTVLRCNFNGALSVVDAKSFKDLGFSEPHCMLVDRAAVSGQNQDVFIAESMFRTESGPNLNVLAKEGTIRLNNSTLTSKTGPSVEGAGTVFASGTSFMGEIVPREEATLVSLPRSWTAIGMRVQDYVAPEETSNRSSRRGDRGRKRTSSMSATPSDRRPQPTGRITARGQR